MYFADFAEEKYSCKSVYSCKLADYTRTTFLFTSGVKGDAPILYSCTL